MAKRKRQAAPEGASTTKPEIPKKVKFNSSQNIAKPTAATSTSVKVSKPKVNDTETKTMKTTSAATIPPTSTNPSSPVTIQIIAGTYDRVLHGVTAAIVPTTSKAPDSSSSSTATFADTFLFNAHTSAIRCLALSPPSVPVPGQSQKVMLATGSTDERINVYNLSAHSPSTKANADAALLSAIARRPIREDARNRELGTLLHHASTVTHLAFPTRAKLLSASEDSTLAVTRTRDWSLLSTIKAPVPNAYGRPSGDTAALGATPSGVNGFAVHPSMKVMLSVSKGERCMRLWNLVTGKKAGVLDFGREVLSRIGEGRHATGEGRGVAWGDGEEFAVGFDRDVLVFGMDSRVRCRVMRDSRVKVHAFAYVPLGDSDEDDASSVLAVSTEDGRVLFFSTATEDLDPDKEAEGKATPLPRAKLIAQLGGKAAGIKGRIKDFKVVQAKGASGVYYVVAASSDGNLRVWEVTREELEAKHDDKTDALQAGRLLGTYETQNRITCVEAFVMIPRPEGVEESEGEAEEDGSDDASSSDDDNDDEE